MHIPVKKGMFEGVVCVNSIYYYDDPKKTVKDFARILKKNGKLIIVTPFIYPIHDAPYDKYRYTEFGIKKLLEDDFDVKEIVPIGGIFNAPAVVFHSLIKGLPLLAPKNLKLPTKILTCMLLYPFYIIAQILSLLDFLDKSGRWATHYFTFAAKRE